MLIGTGRGTELTGQSSRRCCFRGRIDVPKNEAIVDLTRSGPGRCARPSRSTPSRSPDPPERRTSVGAAQCSQDRGNLRLDTIPRRPCRHAIDVTSAGIPPPSTSTIVGQRPGSALPPASARQYGIMETLMPVRIGLFEPLSEEEFNALCQEKARKTDPTKVALLAEIAAGP